MEMGHVGNGVYEVEFDVPTFVNHVSGVNPNADLKMSVELVTGNGMYVAEY